MDVDNEETKIEDEKQAIELEELRLKTNSPKAIEELKDLRSKMILNELEQKHPNKFAQLQALCGVYITEQFEEFKQDRDETLTFLENEEKEFKEKEKAIIKAHKDRIKLHM